MILIIGGRYSGKRSYLFHRFPEAAEHLDDGKLGDAPFLCHLQDLPEEQLDSEETFRKLCAKKAVLCEEIGCGIVPLEASLRSRRERTGRLLIRLASEADEVIRIQCGIPQRIKG